MEDHTTNQKPEMPAESDFEAAAMPPETNEKEKGQTKKSWHKQPGSIAALLMILAAVVIISAWLSAKPALETALPTLTPTLLSAPQLAFETEAPTPAATIQPTVQPTIEQTRADVITYVIQEGDSIFSIASKFNIAPETILWSNRYELGDDPSVYTPGISIYILPVDGVYHIWQQGEGLNGVSEFYGVTPDAIIDYSGNKLNRASLGNLSLPNIAPGTRLIVPGGTRPETVSADSLLTYAALTQIEKLPVGNPESFPAPRAEIIAYRVEEQDTLFTIADKFDLTPETVLWANRYLLGDTPDGIIPGQKLFILPDNGVFHGWSYKENLDKVSSFYNVSRDVILDEPLNQLDRSKFADLSHPNIKAGTLLYVPGGTRPPVTWVTPVGPGEDGVGEHPNVSYLGAYACNSTAWAVGSGNWQFPTSEHWISGYEYTPPTHNGLDYAGRMGYDIYAADSGVIIYSGWSTRGYGNTIVIDHGNGYLSLYAHLMDGGILQSCGVEVYAGQLIGYMGSTGKSTGPHLHFEIRYDGSPVNPHNLGL